MRNLSRNKGGRSCSHEHRVINTDKGKALHASRANPHPPRGLQQPQPPPHPFINTIAQRLSTGSPPTHKSQPPPWLHLHHSKRSLLVVKGNHGHYLNPNTLSYYK